MTPLQTAMMKPSASLPAVMEAPHMQTGVLEPCGLQTALVLEVSQTQTVMVHLPNKETSVMEPHHLTIAPRIKLEICIKRKEEMAYIYI